MFAPLYQNGFRKDLLRLNDALQNDAGVCVPIGLRGLVARIRWDRISLGSDKRGSEEALPCCAGSLAEPR
jgi:hypothetical protein